MPTALSSNTLLDEYRRRRFRQEPDLSLADEEEAEAFVNSVGICLFQPNRGVELPSLWQAAAGTCGPAPRWGQHDRLYFRAWSWKDSIFSRGGVLYAKAFGNYRVFISRSLLPYLYATGDLNYGGEEGDYLELYEDGKLSLDAKNIYASILEHGVSSTTMLRRYSHLGGKGSASTRFERALTQLQRGFMICAVGIADDNAWKYTFRYNTVIRQFPEEVLASRSVTSRAAMSTILQHYVDLVGSTTLSYTSKLFGWDATRLRRAAQDLAEAKRLGLLEDDTTLVSNLLANSI